MKNVFFSLNVSCLFRTCGSASSPCCQDFHLPLNRICFSLCFVLSFFLSLFACFRIALRLEFRNDVTVADKYEVVMQSCFKNFLPMLVLSPNIKYTRVLGRQAVAMSTRNGKHQMTSVHVRPLNARPLLQQITYTDRRFCPSLRVAFCLLVSLLHRHVFAYVRVCTQPLSWPYATYINKGHYLT